MNGVSVGKYISGNSIAHKLDPRVKLVVNITFIVLVFLTYNPLMLGIILAPALLLYLMSPLKKIQLLKMILPIIFIGVFVFIINLFVIKTNSYDYHWFMPLTWWKLTLSDDAIYRTLLLMIRIYIMVLVTTLLISTTKPTALTRAIEDLLWPFKFIGLPIHVIAMIISIALRFIPTLLGETQRIMKAQASRGVDFKNGNTKSKMKSLITLIIPLFVSAFAKAEDLGNAMEVRGYDPYEKRVRYRTYRPGFYDFIVIIVVGGLIALVVLTNLNVHVITLPDTQFLPKSTIKSILKISEVGNGQANALVALGDITKHSIHHFVVK